MCVVSLVLLCRWCDARIGGGQVAFRAPGFCPAPLLRLWAQCSCCFFPWCQGVVSCFLFGRGQGCLVLHVALFPPLQCALGAVAVAGCLGPCSCAPILLLLVRPRGPTLRLGVFLLGFPAAVCAVTPIPTIASLCNTQSLCNTHAIMGSVSHANDDSFQVPFAKKMPSVLPATAFSSCSILEMWQRCTEVFRTLLPFFFKPKWWNIAQAPLNQVRTALPHAEHMHSALWSAS